MLIETTFDAKAAGFTNPVFMTNAAQLACKLGDGSSKNHRNEFYIKFKSDLLDYGYQSDHFYWKYKNKALGIDVELSTQPMIKNNQIVLVFGLKGELV
ncbi:hypothetical protein [Xanthomonas axonopodis]